MLFLLDTIISTFRDLVSKCGDPRFLLSCVYEVYSEKLDSLYAALSG